MREGILLHSFWIGGHNLYVPFFRYWDLFLLQNFFLLLAAFSVSIQAQPGYEMAPVASAGSNRRRSCFSFKLGLHHHFLTVRAMFLDPYSDLWWQQAAELFKNEALTNLYCSSAWPPPLVEEFPWWQISQGALACSVSSSVSSAWKPLQWFHTWLTGLRTIYRIYGIYLSLQSMSVSDGIWLFSPEIVLKWFPF